MISDGGRFLAIGGPAVGDGSFERSVLESDDGLTWRTLARRPFGGDVAMSLTLVSGRLIVVAARSIDVESFRTYVWSSDDGESWDLWVESIGGRHPRYFARIGERWLMQSQLEGGIQSSSDGIEWTTDVPMDGDTQGVGFVVGPGGVLASVTTQGHADRTSMFLSKDGKTWTETALADGADVRIDRTAANERGYLALGVLRTTGGVATTGWWSTDGRTWERSQVPREFEDSYAFADHIVTYGDGFIASVQPDHEGPPRLMWSEEGRAWTYLPEGLEVRLGDTSLLVDGRRLLLYGLEFATHGHEAVWDAVRTD